MGLSALNKWCDCMVGNPPSLLWTEIEKNPTNVEDFRRIIKRAVNERARLQAMDISKFHLTDDMLKDIIKLDFAPGGDSPLISNLQQGMSILNTLPTTANQVSGWQ